MTNVAPALPGSLEDRIAQLEARFAAIDSRALNPPITIGELTDVPTPGSQIAAQWAQEVSARVLHRYASKTALNGWAAPAGSMAVVLDTGTIYRRYGGAWVALYEPTSVTGVTQAVDVTTPGLKNLSKLSIPADPRPRIVHVAGGASLFININMYVTVALANASAYCSVHANDITSQWEQASLTDYNVRVAAGAALDMFMTANYSVGYAAGQVSNIWSSAAIFPIGG